LTADSAYVHWIEGSVVARTPVSGIGVTPVVQNQSGAFDIVSDGTFVYWIKPNTKTSAPYDGAVRRLTSGQTDVAEVVTGINTYAIAADGKNLYWANASDGKIYQAGRDGKGARPISPALDGALTLAVDRTSTFAGLAGSSVVGFAEVPIGGGSLVETTAPYTTPSIEPYKLALDSTHIYSWGYDSANDRTVLIQTPKTLQGNPTIMTGSTTDALLGIASDANFVYFGQSDGIYRIPFASGTPHFLAATKQPVNSLATTNGALFWIDPPAPSSTSGRVMKLAVFPN
jgi:hypothetical protein